MEKQILRKSAILLGAVVLLTAVVISSCTNANGKGKESYVASLIPVGDDGFKQKDLPYSFDALEPYIDKQTMELHFGKHHAGYTSKFNAALADEEVATKDIYEIFANVSMYSSNIRNNGGGYFNHALFWDFMSPDGGGLPEGELLAAIEEDFGSFKVFQELFSGAAASQFGSGWAWLIVDEEGSLKITSTANQDNPLMDVAEVKGTPILNLDVWEHAYYLNYQNKRPEYIKNFWNVVNWKTVEKLFGEAK
ncbi:MAG: superoxide dismutase [Bacteroidales bacterium]